MTKKDYILLSSILYAHRQGLRAGLRREALDHACALLKKDNPNFDEARFRKEVEFPVAFINDTLRKG